MMGRSALHVYLILELWFVLAAFVTYDLFIHSIILVIFIPYGLCSDARCASAGSELVTTTALFFFWQSPLGARP
jgi:hypothetical protein